VTNFQRHVFMVFVVSATLCAGQVQWKLRQRRFDRGRKLTSVRRVGKRTGQAGLRWPSDASPMQLQSWTRFGLYLRCHSRPKSVAAAKIK
jgi:hypothetical protein